jgi:hypothetical protein
LFGDPVRSRLGFGGIHRLLDRPPRGALAHLAADTGLWRGQTHWLTQVRLCFPLDQELSHHIPATELVIGGAAQRQAMRRGEGLHTVPQGAQHPR